MKVLQLGTSGPLYGAERWILALVRNLDPQIVTSHIAAIADMPDAPVPLLMAAQKLGIVGHAINASGRFNPSAILKLRRLIQRHQYDVIHAHGYKADVIALAATIGTKTKTVATPHGWSNGADWKVRFYEQLDRLSFRFFDAVAPLSPALADDLKTRHYVRDRLHLIQNGVDLHEIEAVAQMPSQMQALKAQGPVIGYAGQLIRRKNLSVLLTAFARWNRADANLVMIGEGDQRDELKALAATLGIQQQTHFLGFQDNRLEWMSAFDLFVLPSLEEGIPRCLMEAMALHIPVIASNIPGNRDLVQHGKNGWLFPAQNAADLCGLFNAALSPANSRKVAGAAKATIMQKYSAAQMARGYQALFEGMIAQR